MAEQVFVFGSNLSGVHGKGAALEAARQHGAVKGVGIGPAGGSYAIPTKGVMYFDPRKGRGPKFDILPLGTVGLYAAKFREYAAAHPELRFKVTAVGCGLAGYAPEQVAPMFADCPANCILPPEFRTTLTGLPDHRFWSYEEFTP